MATSLTSNPTSPTPSNRPSIDSRSATPSNAPITNSTEAAAAAAATAASTRPQRQGRNRNALRQFYGLAGGEAQGISELEKEGFDPKKWVGNLCKEKDLGGLLRAENDLINGEFALHCIGNSGVFGIGWDGSFGWGLMLGRDKRAGWREEGTGL